jgi:transposase-like protein
LKSLSTVKNEYSSLIESNLKKTAKKRRYPNSFKEDVVQLYKQGIKSSDIVKTFGISPSGFHHWRQHFKNLEFKKNGKKINKRLIANSQSSFKEIQISGTTEVIIEKDHFLLETPKGFKVTISSQKILVSIIRELGEFC